MAAVQARRDTALRKSADLGKFFQKIDEYWKKGKKNGVRAHPKEREGKEEMTNVSNHKNVTIILLQFACQLL
jgi:hypothetical protein